MAAAGGHNDGGGADGHGIYDPFLVPEYFDDDVLYFLDMNVDDGVMDDPPPPPPPSAPAAERSDIAATAGPSGDNNNNLLVERPPPHSVVVDPTTTTSGPHDVGAAGGTSAAAAAAPRSSAAAASAVHQNALLDCTGCQVLREVVHCNGLEATKLGVHGVAGAGVFHHATLEVHRVVDSNGPPAATTTTMATELTHQSYVDFRGRDYVWVKRYLTEYAQQRAGSGYVVLQDSISAFQDALCTSMIAVSGGHRGGDDDHREVVARETNGGHADERREAVVAQEINGGHHRVVGAGRPTADSGGGGGGAVQAPAAVVEQVSVPAEASAAGPSEPTANKEQRRRPQTRPASAKTALAIQRERASNLQLDDIARYFHLPMVEAAKELRICATVLKGTSRKFHIRRWPYRKIKSIDSQIAKLRRGNGDQTDKREIERLTDYRRRIYAGLE